jgi:hypothetical protein
MKGIGVAACRGAGLKAAESNDGMHPTRISAAFISLDVRGRVMPGVRCLRGSERYE